MGVAVTATRAGANPAAAARGRAVARSMLWSSPDEARVHSPWNGLGSACYGVGTNSDGGARQAIDGSSACTDASAGHGGPGDVSSGDTSGPRSGSTSSGRSARTRA